MAKSTSFNIGEHFIEFIEERISMGRFGNKGEAMRAGLRLLEAEEKKLDALRQHLAVGEEQSLKGESRYVSSEYFKNIEAKKSA